MRITKWFINLYISRSKKSEKYLKKLFFKEKNSTFATEIYKK